MTDRIAEIRSVLQGAITHASRQNLIGYQNGDHYYRSIWGARLEALESVYREIFPEEFREQLEEAPDAR